MCMLVGVVSASQYVFLAGVSMPDDRRDAEMLSGASCWTAQAELGMNSVERLQEYLHHPPEEPTPACGTAQR